MSEESMVLFLQWSNLLPVDIFGGLAGAGTLPPINQAPTSVPRAIIEVGRFSSETSLFTAREKDGGTGTGFSEMGERGGYAGGSHWLGYPTAK